MLTSDGGIPQSVWRYAKWGLVLILLVLSARAAWWSGRNYAGYCEAESRYLTDEEKINIAITDTLRSYPPPLPKYGSDGGTRKVVDIRPPAEPINYADLEEFLRLNKDCCALTKEVREGQSVTPISRLTGRISTFVTVKYLVRYRDHQGNIVSEPSETFRAISNCGLAAFGS